MIFQKKLWVYSFQHESIINWSIAWKRQAFSRYDLWRNFVNKTTFSNTKTVFPTLMLSYVSLQSIQKLSQKTKQEKIVRLFFYCCLKYIYITPRPFGTGSYILQKKVKEYVTLLVCNFEHFQGLILQSQSIDYFLLRNSAFINQ